MDSVSSSRTATISPYNICGLPLLFIPPLFFIVYWSLNGYLLGREYFELVALRRVELNDALALRKRWKVALFIAGAGFAFMLTVPILNIIAPVIATAVMVHLFEAWRAKDGVQDKLKPAGPAVTHARAADALGTDGGDESLGGDDDAIPLPGPDKS